ncbi:MAG: ribonuclease R [Bacillota bacterium]
MGARNQIYQFLEEEAKKPLSFDELLKQFNVSRNQRKQFEKVLEELEKSGDIYKSERGYYGIPEKFNLYKGRIQSNAKGFAFFIPEDPSKDDMYISASNLNGAMHNDKVLVRPLQSSGGRRQEAEVIKVLDRANETVVGELDYYGKYGFVIPDNQRIFTDIYIHKDKINQASNGDKVVVKITRWPDNKRNPEGEVIEVIGHKGEPGVDLEAMIRQLQLPQEFPPEVEKEAENLTGKISKEEVNKREDLRDLPMVTIDGADAKDFDDAVSIEKIDENTVRLGVHIADVSHYIREGSELDQEAYRRGTSIYLVDRVIPMLPERLSNNLCSLRPQEDKLAVSVFIDYNLEPFELVKHEITRSVISSNHRLTYNQVREMLVKDNKKVQQEYEDFFPNLQLMEKLYEKLRGGRRIRGTIDFDFPEIKVILDDEGRPVELRKMEQGVPEQIIEEFMIAANRVVAEEAYWLDEPFLYRVHDEPDPERIKTFNEFVHNFGYHLKGGKDGKVHPGALQQLLKQVSGEDEENIIETMLLRSMKKAIYSPVNIGHFGLSLDYYSHFTSPIRRYPDLVVHRIITDIASQGKLSAHRRQELEDVLPETADHCSLQERRAMEAERDSVDLKRIEYMQQYVGDEFKGIISGVTSFGLFVQLENTAEGLVHVESLSDDYYIYREDQQSLLGERTKKMYQLGDEIEVEVVRASVDDRQLDFKVVN